MPENLTDFRHIFLNDVPMMDVRAPVEFGQGAFPGVVNHPLMNDDERQQVGTCYKQKGQDAAIALGHQLVSGATKQQRIEAWAGFAQAQPQGVLYCFRGGLRSQIVQQWLKSEAGIDYPRVIGGYKALRSFLIDAGASFHGYASDITRSYAYDTGSEFQAMIDAVDAAQQPHSALGDFVGHEKVVLDWLFGMAGRDLGRVVLAGRHLALHRLDPDSDVQGRHEVRRTGCIVQHPLKALDALVLEP